MYIAPGQGQTAPWGQMLMSTENPFHFTRLLQVLKQSLWSMIFKHILNDLYMYIAPEQVTHWPQKFYDNRKAFSLCPYVATFKIISSVSDFIHVFNDFIHVYSPGTRAENPLEINFWSQLKALITSTICCKFQTNLFQFWFYNIFPHVYSPGAGADNPLWTKSWCQQKILFTLPTCCRFQKISLKTDFIHNFSCFIDVYSPGAGADNPLRSEFLYKHKPFVTLVICCKLLLLNDFLTVFPI